MQHSSSPVNLDQNCLIPATISHLILFRYRKSFRLIRVSNFSSPSMPLKTVPISEQFWLGSIEANALMPRCRYSCSSSVPSYKSGLKEHFEKAGVSTTAIELRYLKVDIKRIETATRRFRLRYLECICLTRPIL